MRPNVQPSGDGGLQWHVQVFGLAEGTEGLKMFHQRGQREQHQQRDQRQGRANAFAEGIPNAEKI